MTIGFLACFTVASHSTTKYVITREFLNPNGAVRVVFATIALGMGVDFKGVNNVIHYGAPSSIKDYYQESGRVGRSGVCARSTVYWMPSDCPRVKEPITMHQREMNNVRAYVENSFVCKRKWLLEHFDPSQKYKHIACAHR